jgi:uncharacterized membrane protein YfcA
VGLSLGLTGGGGAIFAVPLLVYGLGVPAREAVAISLAAVGTTAFVGFAHRWKLGQVEVRTGLLFAIAGMMAAPLGAHVATQLPEGILLLLFAGLMIVVAIRLWPRSPMPAPTASDPTKLESQDGPACARDSGGALVLTSKCAAILSILGLLTGFLSGLFGVGGGFVIVPALILVAGMPIHRAVGTSLMVIALVSVSGVGSQLWQGHSISPLLTIGFIAGGIAGLFLGERIGRHLSPFMLQRVFAVAILGVAAFVILRNVYS